MLAANVPASFPIPWANGAGAGFITTPIPTASQISVTPGRASLTDGFPPLNFTPVSAGGVPPWGADSNGILNEITANLQWFQAGGTPIYNSAFSTAIGGYPNGALLASANGTGMWRSTVDNNLTNPDAAGAGWVTAFPAGVVSVTRNLVIDIPTASASATVTADEIVVETALGGQTYKLASFSKTINISTVGAGGMDVAGLPATANVAIYAIYNPTTGASALLGFNATSKAPEVYAGSAMPAGYTASALLTSLIVSTSQFIVCYVQDRHVTINQISQIATSTVVSNSLLSLGCPLNAKNADLNVVFTSSSATNANIGISATSTPTLGTSSFQVAGGSGSGSMALRKFALRTGTSIWYSLNNSAGTPTLSIALTGYDI